LRSRAPEKYAEKGKFGAYLADAAALAFALGAKRGTDIGERSIDAAIMDAADSITYSVHDLVDFYKGGLIDVGRLGTLNNQAIIEIAAHSGATHEGLEATKNLLVPLASWERYDDSRSSRVLVQTFTSHLITTLVENHRLSWRPADGWSVTANAEILFLLAFLQGLTKRFVIDSETMAATQIGHRRVIKRLFRMYVRALFKKEHRLFPSFFRDEARKLSDRVQREVDENTRKAMADGITIESAQENDLVQMAGRLAADVVASLTDSQALALNTRILGLLPQDGFAAQRDA